MKSSWPDLVDNIETLVVGTVVKIIVLICENGAIYISGAVI
jgi:hypothetical protein